MLKMQVSYETGNVEWHPPELVKDVDVHAVANYVLTNDLGKLPNLKFAIGHVLFYVWSEGLSIVYVVVISLDLMQQPTFLLLRSVIIVKLLSLIERMTKKRRSKSRVQSVLVLSNTGLKCLKTERTFCT
jgi:hypothetical protein